MPGTVIHTSHTHNSHQFYEVGIIPFLQMKKLRQKVINAFCPWVYIWQKRQGLTELAGVWHLVSNTVN